MILFSFIFGFRRTDPTDSLEPFFFIFIRKSWKQKGFIFFFTRIGWFLIKKCYRLHIGDGQETDKTILFREKKIGKVYIHISYS